MFRALSKSLDHLPPLRSLLPTASSLLPPPSFSTTLTPSNPPLRDGPPEPSPSSHAAASASEPTQENGKEPETTLGRHLRRIITFGDGPITMAEYMQEVLTNPSQGYYMDRDVFGRKGDFVTSPEVSQLFGESIAVWCMWMWEALGKPDKLRLVELGPGRGTLMSDILRATRGAKPFSASLSVHLVEVSRALRKLQAAALKCEPPPEGESEGEGKVGKGGDIGGEEGRFSSVSGWSGTAGVTWYRHLSEVPTSPPTPTLYILHEFLDALPAHQFQRGEGGWREVMIDTDPSPPSPLHFRRVLAPKPSPASVMLVRRRLEMMKEDRERKRKESGGEVGGEEEEPPALEISPQCMYYAQELSLRVSSHRGAALIVDYGRDGPYGGTVQAIRNHQGVPVLSQPGSADLSAWVDFSALRGAVRGVMGGEEKGEESEKGVKGKGVGVRVEGPVSQAQFLHSLGIEYRLQRLLERSPSHSADLIAGYRRLVGGVEDGSYSDQPLPWGGEGGEGGECASGSEGGGEGGERESEAVGGRGGMGRAYQVMAIVSGDVVGGIGTGFQ